MKNKKGTEASVTGPLLTDLIQRSKVHAKVTLNSMNEVASEPLPQPDLYQDSGSGYNSNFVFPQE